MHNAKRNRWEFPGGKVEKDEKFTDAAIRETFEETGLIIGKKENLVWLSTEHMTTDEGEYWTGLFFYATWFHGESKIMELEKHDKIGWFSLKEIELLPQIPALCYKQARRYLMHQSFAARQKSNINKFFKHYNKAL